MIDKPTIKIDKNIPITSRICKNPFNFMEVGDSCFLAGVTVRSAAVSYASTVTRRTGKVFVRRTCVENGITGVRVWRTV